MLNDLAQAMGREAAVRLREGRDKIEHCLAQLTDEQVWQRPREEMNSIANLILHLIGNVHQWIVSGLGGAADVRNRPAEFVARDLLPKDELLRRLDEVVRQAADVLSRVTEDDLLAARRIQGFDVTGVAAIFDSIPHFTGHAQEIIHMTRMLLGERYRYKWVPQTKEQGAGG